MAVDKYPGIPTHSETGYEYSDWERMRLANIRNRLQLEKDMGLEDAVTNLFTPKKGSRAPRKLRPVPLNSTSDVSST